MPIYVILYLREKEYLRDSTYFLLLNLNSCHSTGKQIVCEGAAGYFPHLPFLFIVVRFLPLRSLFFHFICPRLPYKEYKTDIWKYQSYWKPRLKHFKKQKRSLREAAKKLFFSGPTTNAFNPPPLRLIGH